MNPSPAHHAQGVAGSGGLVNEHGLMGAWQRVGESDLFRSRRCSADRRAREVDDHLASVHADRTALADPEG